MQPQIWSRERFESFLQSGHVDVYVAPARAVPCRCGDLNCHGWRLKRVEEAFSDVPRALTPALEMATV